MAIAKNTNSFFSGLSNLVKNTAKTTASKKKPVASSVIGGLTNGLTSTQSTSSSRARTTSTRTSGGGGGGNNTTTTNNDNTQTENIPEFTARALSAPPTMEEYMKSGFYDAKNIAALQSQLAAYNQSDDQIRSQAEALYAPAYNMQKTAFENQLAQLALDRDRDIQKTNSQYNRTLNSVMAGLTSRGMGRSSMVATRGVETENARNAAISETSYNYLQQQNQLNAQRQQAEAEYAQNIENKASEIRDKNRSQSIALMSQIAQLQQNGYSAYANYLQNKEKQEIQNDYLVYQSKYLKDKYDEAVGDSARKK